MKSRRTAICLIALLAGSFSLFASNLNIDPQREDTNLQHEQSRGLQMSEDKNLQQEQTHDMQFQEDKGLRQEKTHDRQFFEDENMRQERLLNRIF